MCNGLQSKNREYDIMTIVNSIRQENNENRRKNNDNRNIFTVHKIWYKLNRKNEDFLGVVVGEKGAGKSWGSLRLSELVDPNFSMDNVCFSAKEMVELLKESRKPPVGKPLGKGSMVVLDEAGISDTARARNWWSQTNEKIDTIFKLVRYLNIGFLLTTPVGRDIDTNVRNNAHMKLVAKKNDGRFYMIPSWWKYQHFEDKQYYAYPINNGDRMKMLKMNKPSKELREAYEEAAERYKDNKLSDSSASGYDVSDVKEKIIENPEKYSVEYRTKPYRGLNNAILHNKLGVPKNRVSEVRADLLKDDKVKEALGYKDDGDEEKNAGGSSDKIKSKKEKIREIIDENPNLSNKEVSKKVDCTYNYVSRIRNGMN